MSSNKLDIFSDIFETSESAMNLPDHLSIIDITDARKMKGGHFNTSTDAEQMSHTLSTQTNTIDLENKLVELFKEVENSKNMKGGSKSSPSASSSSSSSPNLLSSSTASQSRGHAMSSTSNMSHVNKNRRVTGVRRINKPSVNESSTNYVLSSTVSPARNTKKKSKRTSSASPARKKKSKRTSSASPARKSKSKRTSSASPARKNKSKKPVSRRSSTSSIKRHYAAIGTSSSDSPLSANIKVPNSMSTTTESPNKLMTLSSSSVTIKQPNKTAQVFTSSVESPDKPVKKAIKKVNAYFEFIGSVRKQVTDKKGPTGKNLPKYAKQFVTKAKEKYPDKKDESKMYEEAKKLLLADLTSSKPHFP